MCHQILAFDRSHFGAIHLLGAIEAQRGNNSAAIELFGKALAIDPLSHSALNNLGAVFRTMKRLDEAEEVLRRALTIKPDYAPAFNNLGNILLERGDRNAARTCFQKALEFQPDYVQALNNLGNICKELGDVNQARVCYKKALSLNPAQAEIRKNLGDVFLLCNQLEQAEACYLSALEIKPDYAEAYVNLGSVHNQRGELDKAEECFQKAIAEKEDLADAYSNLGEVLHLQQRFDEAETSCIKVLASEPDHVDALNNLATICKGQGRLDEAEAYCRKALSLAPTHAGAICNLGAIYSQQGKLREAESCLQEGLTLYPDDATIKYNLFSLSLLRGDYKQGIDLYEFRLDSFKIYSSGRCAKLRAHPRWRGEMLMGKTLLIWGEQGVGDEILFAGVIREAMTTGAHLVLESEPRLVSLFARSFPEAEVVPRWWPLHPRLVQNNIDFQIPAGSLPLMFRQSIADFPRHAGYLVPDPARVNYWRDWLRTLGDAPKIGISWRSMQKGGARNGFYSELSQWGEILQTKRVVFVNLQYGECTGELDEARLRFGVPIHEAPSLDLKDDLDDVAALMLAMDLVIAPKTSVSAMAGAIGAPTWLYTLNSDWTMLGTDHLPWYPLVRVYSKHWNIPWERILLQISTDLAIFADEKQAAEM